MTVSEINYAKELHKLLTLINVSCENDRDLLYTLIPQTFTSALLIAAHIFNLPLEEKQHIIAKAIINDAGNDPYKGLERTGESKKYWAKI